MVCLHPGWVQTGMGGARAPLAVPESCAGLRRVMAGLTPAAVSYTHLTLPTSDPG